jgi:hypothetical protein
MLVDARTIHVTPPPQAVLSNCLHLGNIALSLSGSSPDEILIPQQLSPFLENNQSADIEVFAQWVDDLRPQSTGWVFDSGALWQVFHEGEGFVFDFVSVVLGSNPYKRLVVDQTFSSARLLLNHKLLQGYAPIFPLEYPTDELLVTNYLARHRLGVEVHACGFIDPSAGGQLFLGHSGAGKSTTTRLWQAARDPLILSDDRIILRLEDGHLHMYGTPWHGEAAFAEPGEARLERIFILQHGPSNRIQRMSKARALAEVFARCFPPFHNPDGLEGALEFIGCALDVVPCYEFQFVPDGSAVDAVLDFND